METEYGKVGLIPRAALTLSQLSFRENGNFLKNASPSRYFTQQPGLSGFHAVL
jgi:hypothetical protein